MFCTAVATSRPSSGHELDLLGLERVGFGTHEAEHSRSRAADLQGREHTAPKSEASR
jgi:hypothetical protein